MIRFHAYGTPIPKGSLRVAERDRHGRRLPRAIVIPDNPELRGWEKSVGGAALAALARHPRRERFPLQETPLVAFMRFRFERPAGHFGAHGLRSSAPIFPAVRPDVDKCIRAVLDAVTGIVFGNDSRVILALGWKTYAGKREAPGAEAWIAPVLEPEWYGVLTGLILAEVSSPMLALELEGP